MEEGGGGGVGGVRERVMGKGGREGVVRRYGAEGA